MTPVLFAQAVVYTLAAVAVVASAVWWGWELRTRLSLKLEFFRLTNTRWHEYDVHLKKEGRPPARAELHDIRERQSERQSDK